MNNLSLPELIQAVNAQERQKRDHLIESNSLYRYLLEREGFFPVGRMVVQLLVRDAGLEVASRRGVGQTAYVIEINRISDRWIERYFKVKARRLYEALWTGRMHLSE